VIDASVLHCTTVCDGRAECTCGWHSPRVFGDPGPLATWHRCAIGETIDNPYLQSFLAPSTKAELSALGPYGIEHNVMWARRDRLAAEYAWGIPTESVLRRLAELSPICDLGCGTGYWAKLLRDVGADVLAVDANPPLEDTNHWHRRKAGILGQPVDIRHFVDVVKGDAATFDVTPEQTLMLCWPPYANGMAQQALARYGGTRVVYVGEGDGGCTGDDGFHAALAEQWELTASYEIPQWNGIHDDVRVYVRRVSRKRRGAAAPAR
jgi:SAM-dependent methyltransferase